MQQYPNNSIEGEASGGTAPYGDASQEQLAQPGVVYVLSNAQMPDIVKIGMVAGTSIENVRRRTRSLQAGSPAPYRIEYASKVGNARETESILHQIHIANRMSEPGGGREWFRISVESAVATFTLAGLELLGENDETAEPLEDDASTGSSDSVANSSVRGPRFTFDALGIPTGTELVYSSDETITCRVVSLSPPQVDYDGATMTLGRATSLIEGRPTSPLPRWRHDGVRLYAMQQQLALQRDNPEQAELA